MAASTESVIEFDPKLDLVLERTLPVSPEKVWAAYTQADLLKKWFCPQPWKVVEAKIDPRPGGAFNTVFQSPEGEKYPNEGCYLEVVENRRIVWSNAVLPGFRPVAATVTDGGFQFTAFISLEPSGSGTKYKAILKHARSEDRDKHDKMGFAQGWGAALDQMIELFN